MSLVIHRENVTLKYDEVRFFLKQHIILAFFSEYLTIGIPTIHRMLTGTEYFEQTLRSLLRHIAVLERREVTILVFPCEIAGYNVPLWIQSERATRFP